VVFDIDVPRQRAAPTLQALLRAGKIRRHYIQQMRAQQRAYAEVFALEISG
jgi:hypothetical protein